MPHRNRVQPDGEIIAHPARGLFMGNRGILHDATGALGRARWRHKAWVCCATEFNNRRRKLLQPNHYTELFFLDEASAFAAGHRPCAECRRSHYTAFRAALDVSGPVKVVDNLLHAARAIPRAARLRHHTAEAADLPDGAMIRDGSGTFLTLWHDMALPYAPDGYGPPRTRPQGMVTLLTAPPFLDSFRNGYTPRLHPSAEV